MVRRLTQILRITLIIVSVISVPLWLNTYGPENEIEIIKVSEKRHPYQDEYERMLYPTVRITAGFSTGSGVIFEHSSDRDSETTNKHEGTQIEILTAAHVVGYETTVNIELRRDRDSELYNAEIITGTVVLTDTVKDLALIRIETTNSHKSTQIYSAHLASENYQYYLFTPIWAVGCSLGLEPRPSFGHITSRPFVSISGCFEVSAPILPGNSGGPVYDGRTYEVIGIAVWVKLYNGQLVTTMAGVVPIGEIHKFLNQVDKVISK